MYLDKLGKTIKFGPVWTQSDSIKVQDLFEGQAGLAHYQGLKFEGGKMLQDDYRRDLWDLLANGLCYKLEARYNHQHVQEIDV